MKRLRAIVLTLLIAMAFVSKAQGQEPTNQQLPMTHMAGIPGLVLPRAPQWAEPVWHLYVVQTQRRAELVQALDKAEPLLRDLKEFAIREIVSFAA